VATSALSRHLSFNLGELREKGCRTVHFGQREVFELCFQRDGTSYHLYLARRNDVARDQPEAKARFATSGDFASAAWTDAQNIYALVTRAGAGALQRAL